MYRVDLNSDLGESFGRYTLGSDDQIIPLITSANVACGFHASDPVVMNKTIAMAREAGIHVGAHPGYPDLMGFGRRNMTISPAEAKAYTLYQIGALDAFCKAAGLEMQHVKPHGAFYNMAAKDYKLAHGICEAIAEYNPKLILMALSGSEMIRAAEDCGLRAASEVFADRAYEEDGTLVNRAKEGAMITDEDEAIARVVRMIKEQKVTAITGKDIPLKAVPVASFVIILLIWAGNRMLSLYISALVALPLLYLNTLSGLKATDPKLLEMATVFHMPTLRRLRFIYLPALFPYLYSAFQTALGMAWKSGVAAEVIGQPLGSMGNGLYNAKIYLETGELLSWTIAIILISYLFERLFLAGFRILFYRK